MTTSVESDHHPLNPSTPFAYHPVYVCNMSLCRKVWWTIFICFFPSAFRQQLNRYVSDSTHYGSPFDPFRSCHGRTFGVAVLAGVGRVLYCSLPNGRGGSRFIIQKHFWIMIWNLVHCVIHFGDQQQYTDLLTVTGVIMAPLARAGLRKLTLQGGPKKVSQIIFAITLSTVIQFS